MVPREAGEVAPYALQASERRLDLVARRGGGGPEQQRLQAARLLLQGGLGLRPGIVRSAAHEVDRPELDPHLHVGGLERLGPEQDAEGLPHLAELEVSEAEVPQSARMVRLETEDVAVLEHGFTESLGRGVPVGPLQVPGLLGLR